MAIRAVVFDIGGVLEINQAMDLSREWELRFGVRAAEIGNRLTDIWAGGAIGTITEEEVHEAISDRLGLSRDVAEAMMAQMWVRYLGVGNTELIEYARRLRPRYRTGILSNSFVGAREREQDRYGFEDLVDELVYSHEVGMSKPEPEIYMLTCARLGVRPEETIFLDDVEPNVVAAREIGIHAFRYRDNARAIEEIEAVLAGRPTVDPT